MKTIECEVCGGRGLVPIGDGIRGLERCKRCYGLGKYDVILPPSLDSVKLNKFEDAEMTKVSISANQIITDAMINNEINKILGSGYYLKELNDLIIKDTNERYIRELLNRIHNAIYLIKDLACYEEDTHQYCDDLNYNDVQKIVDVLMGVDKK